MRPLAPPRERTALARRLLSPPEAPSERRRGHGEPAAVGRKRETRPWAAYNIVERGGRRFWNRVGSAFHNRDGSNEHLPRLAAARREDPESAWTTASASLARTATTPARRPSRTSTRRPRRRHSERWTRGCWRRSSASQPIRRCRSRIRWTPLRRSRRSRGRSRTRPPMTGVLNLNRATEAELRLLPGHRRKAGGADRRAADEEAVRERGRGGAASRDCGRSSSGSTAAQRPGGHDPAAFATLTEARAGSIRRTK